MSDQRGLTRRRVLSALAGAAGVGVVGGAGTRAILTDSERIPGGLLGNPYTGGHLRLRARCGDAACRTDRGSVAFAFTDIQPPATGSTELCLQVQGSPAWLWLRTSPAIPQTLAEELTVSLSYGDGTPVEANGNAVEEWPLNTVLKVFDGGQLLAADGPDGAVPPGDQRCVTVDWSLPDTDGVAGDAIEFEFTFAAIQYRADASPSNPWTNST